MIRPCCLTGHVATGEPKGEMKTIGGVDAYVATPAADKAQDGCAVVLLTDVFGLINNAKLLADSFAEQAGFLCVVPDLFHGKALAEGLMEKGLFISDIGVEAPTSFGGKVWRAMQKTGVVIGVLPPFAAFLIPNFPPSRKVPLVQAVVQELREKHGVSKVGLVGYCFGGMLGVQAAKVEGLCQGMAVAHCDFKVPQDLQALKAGGLFVFADRDWSMPDRKREAAVEFLQTRSDHTFKFKFYPGTYHGFAVRGDDRVPEIQAAKEDAFQEMARFLTEELGKA